MMLNRLSDFTNSRDNNFNLIRFIAALAVLFSHCYPTTNTKDELITQFGFDMGDIAVDVFFVASGFLVTNSLVKRYDLRTFFIFRFLRIYPGLWVSVIFNVFVIGVLFTSLDNSAYLFNRQTIVFLIKNSILVLGEANQLPGVFKHNPYHTVVNASMWSLPWEVRMYLMLIFIGFISHIGKANEFRKRVSRLVTAIAICTTTIYISDYYLILFEEKTSQFFRLSTMFFIGSLALIYQQKIFLSWHLLFTLIIILFFFSFTKNLLFVPYLLLISYLVFFAAYIPAGFIRKFNLLPDYSYGLYIYGFPVQQSLAHLYPKISVLPMLLSSFVVTLLLAAFSWHFVEEPSLKLKKRLLKTQLFPAHKSVLED